MDSSDQATIIAAIVTGTFGGYIGAYMSYVIAKKARKHELKLKKDENERADSQEIVFLIAELKASLTKVRIITRDLAYAKLYYWKAFYAQKIRFKDQDNRAERLEIPGISDAEKSLLNMEIKHAKGKIKRAAEAIPKLQQNYDIQATHLNNELLDIIKLLNKLALVSNVNLSSSENYILDFVENDLEDLRLNEIQTDLKKIKTIDDLNAYTNVKALDDRIKNYLDKYIEPVKGTINSTTFL